MKKKVLWAIFTLCLSILTIYGLFYNSGLSLSELWTNIKNSSPLWLIPAVLCMIGFIFFEGRSLVLILRTLGYPAKKRRGFLYASADIYFSSITPSATGGQPASAYFMYKDGVSAIEVTVSLILNLTMYTLALVTLGFFTLIFFPGIFLEFNTASKVMILIGIFVMILLAIFFIILLKKQSLVLKIGNIIISILHMVTRCITALISWNFRQRYDNSLITPNFFGFHFGVCDNCDSFFSIPPPFEDTIIYNYIYIYLS